MLASERIAPAGDPTPTSGAARRFGLAALGLVLLPIVVEAAALDPRVLVGYRAPLFAALRLAMSNALPYLVVAASIGALAMVLGGRTVQPGRASIPLLGLAAALAALAAITTPSFHDALLAGDVRVEGTCARVGGPLSGCVELDPIALEEAGGLARILVPASAAPWQATVRWVGTRSGAADSPGTRVELVAGGAAIDVTDELRALPPGGAAVFEHTFRLGPDTGHVRLRLADDPLPPAVFFDARRSVDVVGLAVEAGAGDRAWRAEPVTGPGALPVPTLRVEGEHVDGGHAVVVLSGEVWGVHDLGALLAARGELELALAGAGPWRVRLVGEGAESASIPLSALTRSDDDGIARYTLPLDTVPFGPLSPRLVVGVALAYDGPPGPFALDIAGARAALGGSRRSGYALGTLATLDPGAPPAEAMIVVGEPAVGGLARHGGALRLAAAILGLVGAVGLSTLRSAGRALPIRAPLALAVGPLLVVVLEPLVRVLAAPRLEHVPLGLAAAAVAAAIGGLAAGRAEATPRPTPAGTASAEEPRLASVEALLGVAALGIVAAHVSADATGQPWVAHPPADRLFPVLVHALASGFEAPVFVLAVLFLVAHRHHGAGQGAGRTIAGVIGRLLPAFALWSAAYLFLRHGKALAFGYDMAYRRELAQGATWLRAAFLGGAQYHLYVLPLVLVLVVVFPLFSPAVRRPILGLGVLAALAAWPALDSWVYASVTTPEARTWALRGTMAIGFAGYGLLAFALYGLAGRARGLLLSTATLVALAAAALLVRGAWDVADSGSWQLASRPVWLATWLLPAAVFTLFLAADPVAWPAWLRRLGVLAPGVYLVHPAVLDLFEIAELRLAERAIAAGGAALGPAATVGINFVGVSLVSVLLVAALARVRPLRFVVALGPDGPR